MVLPYLKVCSLHILVFFHAQAFGILDVQGFIFQFLWWIISWCGKLPLPLEVIIIVFKISHSRD
jgi:hypothetical protein